MTPRSLRAAQASGFFASVSRNKPSGVAKHLGALEGQDCQDQNQDGGDAPKNSGAEAPPASAAAARAAGAIKGRYCRWSDTCQRMRNCESKKPSAGNNVTAKTPSPTKAARPQLRRKRQQTRRTAPASSAGRNDTSLDASTFHRG